MHVDYEALLLEASRAQRQAAQELGLTLAKGRAIHH